MELIKVENNQIELFDSAVAKVRDLIKLEIQVNSLKEQLKEELQKAMEEYDVKSFEHPLLSAVYVAPTTRESIDSKQLKTFYPEVAKEVTKISPVKASVRIKLK